MTKVNAFHHGIGLEDKEVVALGTAQDGAVIPNADGNLGRIRFPAAGQRVKQTFLTERGERFRGGHVQGPLGVAFIRRRLKAVMRLKQPWMYMGRSSDPEFW